MKAALMNRIKLYIMSMIGALFGTVGAGLLTASGAKPDTVLPVVMFSAGCLFMAWLTARRR